MVKSLVGRDFFVLTSTHIGINASDIFFQVIMF
jgi:hypothetical protein